MAKKKKKKVTAQEGVETAADAQVTVAREPSFFSDTTNMGVILTLVAGCLLLYGQTIWFNFVGLDDSGYVAANPMVAKGLTGETIQWAFTTYAQTNWHPLTWLSYLLDTTLFGNSPSTYHLVNVLFHVANSVLLFLLLKTLTGSTWRSAFVSAIFAFHPAHVESVAWISERKDVLSTLFWILATYFYLRYVRLKEAGVGDRSTSFYLLMIGAMALGLMAKPMLVTLPFTLLLLDIWPLKRLEDLKSEKIVALVTEKLPLFVLSIGSSILTVIAQRSGGAVILLEEVSFYSRVLNAVVSYAKYFVMMFAPVNLGVFYPYNTALPAWQIVGTAILLIGITAICILQFKNRKYLAVGWFWFLGTLVPVIGLVQIGAQNLADRYTYVPYIGLGIMIVWFAAELLQNVDKKVVAVAAGILILAMSGLTFQQVRAWRDSETLFLQTLAVTKNNGFVEQKLCLHYMDQKRSDAAETYCRSAVQHNPNHYDPHKLLGVINFEKQSYEEAVQNLSKAIAIVPEDNNSHSAIVRSYFYLNRPEEMDAALERIKTEAATKPIFKDTLLRDYIFLGYGYSQKNEPVKAAAYLQKALEINPEDIDTKANLAMLSYRSGEKEKGAATLQEIVKANPNRADFYNLYGQLLADYGKIPEAIENFEKALKIKPDLAPAKAGLQRLQANKKP